VAALAAEPAEEGALEQLGVEAVGLGPAVLAGDGDAGGVDHVRLDAARPQPAGQPEAVAAGLEGHGHSRDRAPGLGGLAAPALEKAEQRLLVGFELLERLPLDAGDDPGHEPTRLAQLDDRDERAVRLEGSKAPAQAIRIRHGSAPPVARNGERAARRRSLHSFCTSPSMPVPARSSPAC
jgi:hypothetical protein